MEEKCYLPAVAMRGMTVLPGMILHFDINRARSIEAVQKAMVNDQRLFLVSQQDASVEEPKGEDLYTVGTIARIKQMLKLPNRNVRIMVEGMKRARLLTIEKEDPYLVCEVQPLEDQGVLDPVSEGAMARVIREQLEACLLELPQAPKELRRYVTEEEELARLLDGVAGHLPMPNPARQRYLEEDSLEGRFRMIGQKLSDELEIQKIKKNFQEMVKNRIDENQKEYILREQMKLIREELGEENSSTDADHYLEELEKLKIDKASKEKIEKEISRFRALPYGSQESSVARTYIEALLDMPWNKASKEILNLKKAKEILDEDHYGLEKVKDRVLEYLAVRALNGKGESPILCLVGPPGTGKTSIARSVARALNRKYVRICLGGVRDEAEIRGHRKTYVGAMPGRIAAGIRQAGVKNPLMLLDEIDKVSSDYKGDVSSALLEVLDGEQNSKFRDHYLELPLDLSEVLFIATANSTQTIPGPLLDRLELIEVSSYTENEKYHIADQYLAEKQRKKNGLTKEQFTISPDALKKLIRNYTREAGVRSLERRIGELCRKAAREILEGKREQVRITCRNLSRYLGKEMITFEDANEEDAVGIVRGLAWTSVGGDTLQIEVNVMPGKGEISLTGQLGDVMKESAQTAISYIRSISGEHKIPEDYFEHHDIHIHIPEGAVPKDGPSAGITMATAILSAVKGEKVRADVAMTGEITLRGRVLPIGGLKEKLLAAKMARLKRVLVPEENRRDVEELSREITDGLEILYVKQMEQVWEAARVPEGEQDGH